MIYYVDILAGREGNGSKETPFRRINDAARAAMPGDEILVAPGVYREYVNPVHAGTEEQRITYRSSVPRGAVITGAEELEAAEEGIYAAAQNVQDATSFLPDYAFKGSESALGTTVSGIVGALIVVALMVGAAMLFKFFQNKKKAAA